MINVTDNDVVQEALARHDKSPRTRARDDMDMERLLKVFVIITVIVGCDKFTIMMVIITEDNM